MTEPVDTAVATAEVIEQQSFARFLEALRHLTRFMTGPAVENPLDAAAKRIETNPAYTQSRLLTRLLAAMASRQGEFRIAEISVFDTDTLAVIVALMNLHDAGTATPADWQRAVDRAHAAELKFDS